MSRLFSRFASVAIVCLAASSSSAPALAQDTDPPAYQVEVIVFRHSDPFAAGETFDLSRTSPFIPTFSDTLASREDPAGDGSAEPDEAPAAPRRLVDHVAVAADNLQLAETARRIGNAERFSLLGHFGWLQDAPATEEAPAQRVRVGGVRGQVLLSRSRYLRLDVDLGLNVDGQPLRLTQTRRRVQLDKPHYLDHPYLGVIVQVSRAPAP